MILAQPIEEQETEAVAPLEAVAMVAVSEARTFGELAKGIGLYNTALKEKFRRLREIDRGLNG
jgi:hypothetical protein